MKTKNCKGFNPIKELSLAKKIKKYQNISYTNRNRLGTTKSYNRTEAREYNLQKGESTGI